MKQTANRKKICASTRNLVLKYGIVSVSMDDIASLLGMSKKTLYLSFKSKDELIYSVVHDLITQNHEYCDIATISSVNAIDELFKNLELLDEIFRSLNPSIIFDLKKHHEKSFHLVEKFKNEFILEKIVSNIHRGIAEGLFREDTNVEIISRFRLESVFIPFSPEFLQSKFTVLEIEKEMLINYMYGLATEKGYNMIAKYLKQQQLI